LELILVFNLQDSASSNSPITLTPSLIAELSNHLAGSSVRGAILVAVASHNCSLFEYSALEIKKAVTGYGQADKNQVRIMVQTLLNIKDKKLETDTSDALATAFCHLNSRIFYQKIEESEGER
jgi:Holliday junction resolvasome RuvABC endonuclease subunit